MLTLGRVNVELLNSGYYFKDTKFIFGIMYPLPISQGGDLTGCGQLIILNLKYH